MSDSAGGSSVTASTGMAVAGESLSYTITVSNPSSQALSGTVTDPPDALLRGITWSASGSMGAAIGIRSGAGSIVDDDVALPPGASVTFTIEGTVSLTATGTLANVATLTPTRGPALVATDLATVAEFVISDDSGGSSPTAEQPAGRTGTAVASAGKIYSLVISNTSTDRIAASVSDAVPAGVVGVTWMVALPRGASASVLSGNNGIVDDSISVPGNSLLVFSIAARIAPTAPSTVVNTAILTPAGGSGYRATVTDDLAASALPPGSTHRAIGGHRFTLSLPSTCVEPPGPVAFNTTSEGSSRTYRVANYSYFIDRGLARRRLKSVTARARPRPRIYPIS
jgi:uncharacterized repeat protein (TIGR01451 family)